VLHRDDNVLDKGSKQLDLTVVKILIALLIREEEKAALVVSL
jgi:hypothetical protein